MTNAIQKPFELVDNIPDPFDLESLALGQDFSTPVGVRKLLTTVPVRKPNAQDFIRVNPHPDYRRDMLTLELREDREQFIVVPELETELFGEVVRRTIFTAVSRSGILFLWPVVIPPDGQKNEWWRSAREAAELAMTAWVRIRSNLQLGAHEIFKATGDLPDPEWPDVSFQELIKLGYRDKLIRSADHPVVRHLRGLA